MHHCIFRTELVKTYEVHSVPLWNSLKYLATITENNPSELTVFSRTVQKTKLTQCAALRKLQKTARIVCFSVANYFRLVTCIQFFEGSTLEQRHWNYSTKSKRSQNLLHLKTVFTSDCKQASFPLCHKELNFA